MTATDLSASYENVNRYVSVYGNAAYTYDDRYSLTGSLRWDRSNLWGTSSKFQNKPIWSVGASWIISKEKFFHADYEATLADTYGLDYEDWRDDLEADYPDLSEDERISLMYEINGDYLDDERANLNVQLSQPILVVGDLGLWNGRRMGYKEIPSGNIRDCLYSDTDYSTWYVDRLGDLRCDAIHHDGTNFYLYRVYKDSASPSQIELLKEKLYRGIATRADITRVTRRLGDDIAKVYGFSIPRQRQAVAMER